MLLAVLCFVVAHLANVGHLLYIGVLLLAAVAASVATLYVVRRTERVTRSFTPDIAMVGRTVEVRLRVEIRSPLPGAQGRWRDTLPSGMAGEAAGVFPETLSGMRAADRGVPLTYSVMAQRRGIRPIGPVSVVTTDPFGFARRRHTIGRALPLTVAPAIVDLGPLAHQRGAAGGSTRSATDQLGQGADNLVPRPYAPGDSTRRIHWRASAHRDELMVRQEEQETTPEAVVVLDCGLDRWDGDAARAAGADPSFELAVSACVSAAARLVREGYVVSVVDADGAPLGDAIDGGDAAGVEQLAIDIATITARRSPRSASATMLLGGTTTGPLVYVTGAIGETDAAHLAPLAHRSSLPILLTVARRSDALTAAAAAGWRVAAISSDTELIDAWAAIADRETNHVSR